MGKSADTLREIYSKSPEEALLILDSLIPSKLGRPFPILTGCLIALSDFLVVALFTWIAGAVDPRPGIRFVENFPAVAAFLGLAMYSRGLYPGFAISPPEELRRTVMSSTIVILGLQVAAFVALNDILLSRDGLLLLLVGTSTFVPLGRALLRWLYSKKSWWGSSVLILGAGKTCELVIETLRRDSGLGLKPLLALDDNPLKAGKLSNVPVVGGLDLAKFLVPRYHLDYAIAAIPGVSGEELSCIIEDKASCFRHVLIIPNLFGVGSLWCTARDLGGIVGLELRQKLLSRRIQLFKRCMDLFLTLLVGVFAFPMLILTALLIRLESPGPALYRQTRLGKDGKEFGLLKFRSMYVDAEERLQELLDQNPILRQEYDTYHKLREDPRVTRVGKFIRKFSIDELPQLWNVIAGHISLVGPRAYLPREQKDMLGKEKSILRVLPGVTGLWQVSGRHDVSFRKRLELDILYVRNWSPWLDIYLLARTVWVVLFHRGC